MPYKYKNSKGSEYYLNCRITKLGNGKERTLYYFSKEPKEGAVNAVPKGYQVSETANGLPVLKKTG